MLDICLLGTGGMMPLPYRWLTSMMARCSGSNLLIDCGEGTQVALKEKGWSPKPIDVICFTHYHGDHISGLPGLLLTMGNADRKEPLTLIGPKGLERVVTALRVIAPELPFEIKFIEITQPEQTFELNGYRLKAFRVNHNVVCYGYTIEIDRAGKFDLERALSQEIPKQYWKPFAFEELLARVRVLVRKTAAVQKTCYEVGGLEVHVDTHQVLRNGKEIALSSKEFALLRYMVQNEGIVLSREKLEQHLWNYDYMGSSNVVDVYIRYLRKKIDEGFEPKLIHTVRGAGYVLRVNG